MAGEADALPSMSFRWISGCQPAWIVGNNNCKKQTSREQGEDEALMAKMRAFDGVHPLNWDCPFSLALWDRLDQKIIGTLLRCLSHCFLNCGEFNVNPIVVGTVPKYEYVRLLLRCNNMLYYDDEWRSSTTANRPLPGIRLPNNTFHGSRLIKAGTGRGSFIRTPTANVPTSRSVCDNHQWTPPKDYYYPTLPPSRTEWQLKPIECK